MIPQPAPHHHPAPPGGHSPSPHDIETNFRYPQLLFNSTVKEILDRSKKELFDALEGSIRKFDEMSTYKTVQLKRDYEGQLERKIDENKNTEKITVALEGKVTRSYPRLTR